jgi:hypothetical protein
MDVEQLHIVLQQSFAADAAIRKPAEETIKNLKNLPGAAQLLLQVAAEKQVRWCCWVAVLVCYSNQNVFANEHIFTLYTISRNDR